MNKKRKCIVASAITLVILLFLSIIILPFNMTKTFNADDYYFALDFCIELDDDIPVMSQTTNFTCFAVSMAIVRNYFNFETTEESLLRELDILNLKEGLLPIDYLSYANKAFSPLSFSVSMLNPKSQAEILNIVTESLVNGLPVVFFYSAIDDWFKPKYNTHYGVIYGIDMSKQTVKISNPYGYLEELSFEELFEGLSFQSYESEPLLFHFGRMAGYIKPNNLFVLEIVDSEKQLKNLSLLDR